MNKLVQAYSKKEAEHSTGNGLPKLTDGATVDIGHPAQEEAEQCAWERRAEPAVARIHAPHYSRSAPDQLTVRTLPVSR